MEIIWKVRIRNFEKSRNISERTSPNGTNLNALDEIYKQKNFVYPSKPRVGAK